MHFSSRLPTHTLNKNYTDFSQVADWQGLRIKKTWIFCQLTAAGFSIALDDFGTGYSSIAYLDRLTFHTLKLDRAFSSGIRFSNKRTALVKSVIEMAHRLNLQVVCEGVETADDLKFLQDLRCDFVQGFYIAAPLSVEMLVDKWILSSAKKATA